MTKGVIRKKMIEWRKGLSDTIREEKNEAIFNQLINLSQFKSSKNILFYYSVRGEVDTTRLINECILKKNLFLPKIIEPNIFQPIEIRSPLELKKGPEGVPEPTGKIISNPSIDLVIVPGVAFNLSGDRLGMGKGYYDRYFSKNKTALRIALAYEKQVLDSIPKDPYDEPVDLIVTEESVYICRSGF